MFSLRNWCAPVAALLLTATVSAQTHLPPGHDLEVSDGVQFVLNIFDRHSIVAISDLPGCEELHQFLQTLVQSPGFRSKVNVVVVDFGNPIFQSVVDRYVVDGELMPESVLRHVWDDTTESPSLTWDSPVYAQFFDAIRAANLAVPKERRIHVVLGDVPIRWRKVKTKEQWLAFRGQAREQALAEKVDEILNRHERALVVAARSHLLHVPGDSTNARALIEKTHPGQVFFVIPESRFGAGDVYKEIEAREAKIPTDSIALLQDTWLGSVPVADGESSECLQQAADAVLYLGASSQLTRIQPFAYLFRDDEFWAELNRRWRLVHGETLDLLKAGLDLRGSLDPRAPRTPAVLPPPPQGLTPVDAVEFVLEKLDEYPMVGIGDQHMCLEFYDFVTRLVMDPRLPGRIQDIVVETGNPQYQALIDRYVLDGQSVPLAERKQIWQIAAVGWYESNSPVYERFFDTIRSVNLALPQNKRIRLILGDAPIDIQQLRASPEDYLLPFIKYKETLQDPRELSLAAAVKQVLAAGHHGIIISGNGHLKLMGRPGNARHIFQPSYPGKFYLIDQNGPEYPGWPAPSVVVTPNDHEPSHATLWLGPWDSRTLVRPSPLIYRDPDFWATINLIEEVSRRKFPLDLADPIFEYRGRYFQPQ